jgi:hypothetical protein
MKRVLDFHDSVVASITSEGPDVVVVLDPAYVHEAPHAPGVEAGACYRQAVKLRFFCGQLRNTLPATGSPELYAGTVEINGITHDSVLPLPFEGRGPATTSLAYGHLDAVLEITSEGLRCQAVGPAVWESAFPGAV